MSVALATMGMFRDCCGVEVSGGAPPYRQDAEEHVAPVIFVQNVEMIDIDENGDLIDKISITLKDNGIVEDF